MMPNPGGSDRGTLFVSANNTWQISIKASISMFSKVRRTGTTTESRKMAVILTELKNDCDASHST